MGCGRGEPAAGVASIPLFEDTIISLPEGIALQETDVQLRLDPRDGFQSQITEEEAFCGYEHMSSDSMWPPLEPGWASVAPGRRRPRGPACSSWDTHSGSL